MTTATAIRRDDFIDVPGLTPARINRNHIVCVRIEASDNGNYVVVHTDQGFAFGTSPDTKQSAEELYEEILSLVWPLKGRTTK